MIRLLGAVLLLSVCFSQNAFAQDTLPKFTVVSKGNNRIVISWTNTYPYTSQLSIQRSFDSTKNFKTIITVPDPSVPQNGFVDAKAAAPNMFYRLFIVLDSGRYQFSKSKRPAPDTARVTYAPIPPAENKRVVVSDSMTNKDVKELKEKLQEAVVPTVPKPEKFFEVIRKDSLIRRLAEKDFKKFRDSIVYITKDTMVFRSVDTIFIKPFVPKEVYKASRYVFTEKFGNVMIALPEAATKNFSIGFFDENKKAIFEIKKVKASSLILDKVNFLHAGWFWFELYEDGKLKEKNKFFISKDF